jgi:hypothetical protein
VGPYAAECQERHATLIVVAHRVAEARRIVAKGVLCSRKSSRDAEATSTEAIPPLSHPVPNNASILPGSVARMALRITGSRELANASRVLPLIPTRRFLISAQPSDQLTFEWISVKTWVY